MGNFNGEFQWGIFIAGSSMGDLFSGSFSHLICILFSAGSIVFLLLWFFLFVTCLFITARFS